MHEAKLFENLRKMTLTDKEKLEAIDYLMGTMISLGMVSSLKEQDPEFGEMLEQIAKILEK